MIAILVGLICSMIIVLNLLNNVLQRTEISKTRNNSLSISKFELVREVAKINNNSIRTKEDIEDSYIACKRVLTIRKKDDVSLLGLIKLIDPLSEAMTEHLLLKVIAINVIQYLAVAIFMIYYILTMGKVVILLSLSLILFVLSLMGRVLLYINKRKVKKDKILPNFFFLEEENKLILEYSEDLMKIKSLIMLLISVLLLIIFRIYLLS